MLNDNQKQALVDTANAARKHAYAPYSAYPVGAALLTTSGKTFTGVNVENAAYPTSMCAERSAVFKAVTEGERMFSAIAIVTKNGGSPCGSCRQVLAEFGLEILVIIADGHGRIQYELPLRTLLPHSFGPADLENEKAG